MILARFTYGYEGRIGLRPPVLELFIFVVGCSGSMPYGYGGPGFERLLKRSPAISPSSPSRKRSRSVLGYDISLPRTFSSLDQPIPHLIPRLIAFFTFHYFQGPGPRSQILDFCLLPSSFHFPTHAVTVPLNELSRVSYFITF